MHSKQINRETGKTLEKVISEFKKGIFHSCYLLYGEEEYLVKDATRKIIDHLIPDDCDRDFNLFYIDGDSQDIDGLCESLCTTPLIPARKVIVLRDTNIFQSKETIPEVIRKIRDCLDKDQAKAIRLFTTFIKLSGLTLTDLTDNRWQRIPDEEWQAITGSEEAGQREAWLPRIIDLCSRQGLDEHSARENTERLSDLLTRGLPAGHHLVITTDTVDKRKKLFKTISEVGIIINFDRIKGETRQKSKLMEIANETLNAHGKKLSADAWLAIGKKTGYGLRNSMGAIEQIISYAGDKKTINSSDIEEAIGKSKEDIVFDLTAALSEKNFRRALVTLNNLFEQGMNHLLIHSLLAKEIRLLLHAKIVRQSGKITNYDPAMEYGYFQKTVYPTIKACSSDTGGETLDFATQNPYVIFLALKNTERFSLSNLKRHLQNLVSIDIYFKSTSKDPKLTLEHFILDVCSS